MMLYLMSATLTSCSPETNSTVKAIYLAKLGEHQKAVDGFTKTISLAPNQRDPNLASTYYYRACEYAQLKQYDRAIDDCDRCLGLNPRYVSAYSGRGSLYDTLGQYQKAIADYRQWISLSSKDATAYQRRGNAYTAIGQYQKSVDDCTTAINLDPKFALAYATRATAYKLLKNDTFANSDKEMASKLGYVFK